MSLHEFFHSTVLIKLGKMQKKCFKVYYETFKSLEQATLVPKWRTTSLSRFPKKKKKMRMRNDFSRLVQDFRFHV